MAVISGSDAQGLGLCFAQFQPAAGEELGQARDDVTFEHLLRKGGDHEVVGIPDEVYSGRPRQEAFRKKRTISAEASGPVGSV